MRLSEAKGVLAEVVAYNLEEFDRGGKHDNFVVPYFVGDPGVGKTSIPKQVAREVAKEIPTFAYRQAIVAQYDAGEMAGLPFMGEKRITWQDADGNHTDVEHQMIRLRPNYLPDPKDPAEQMGIFNLDELPQAFMANLNIVSQLTNEWRIGDHQLSRGITICCTGNKPENKAGTTSLPMHLKDRLLFLEVEANIDDVLEYFAAIGVDHRIRSYLRQNQGALHEFVVGQNAFPTPRSWEKTSALLSMNFKGAVRTQVLSGQIGAGRAVEFETYLRIEDRLPKIDDIIADPEGVKVFGNRDADILYMLMAGLADAATPKNIGQIIKYINRLPNQEFVAYWASDATQRDPSLLHTRDMTKWKLEKGSKIVI